MPPSPTCAFCHPRFFHADKHALRICPQMYGLRVMRLHPEVAVHHLRPPCAYAPLVALIAHCPALVGTVSTLLTKLARRHAAVVAAHAALVDAALEAAQSQRDALARHLSEALEQERPLGYAPTQP
eukprot:6207270-Pleurochrysis_carterae.AAC.3